MQELQILKQGPFPPPSLTNSHISLIKRQSDCIFKLLNKAIIIIWGFYYPCSYSGWVGKQPALLGWREQSPRVPFFLSSQTAGSGNNDLWILIEQEHRGLFDFRSGKLKLNQNEFVYHASSVYSHLETYINLAHPLCRHSQPCSFAPFANAYNQSSNHHYLGSFSASPAPSFLCPACSAREMQFA